MVTDKTRRSTFIEQNLGLVHSCAGRFRGRGFEYVDLYSAGCMGLVKAYDGFDESRGVCFSTYAVPVILGEIKKLFRELKKTNPFVEGNIFMSVEIVNLSTVIAYKKDGVKHHFLENYDSIGKNAPKAEDEAKE